MEISGETDGRLRLGILIGIFVMLGVAGIYAFLESRAFLQGHHGDVRGAIILALSVVFALCLIVRDARPVRLVAITVIALTVLGTVDLLLHSPAAPLLAMTPRFENDFKINLAGAREMYGHGRTPYHIEQEYHLPNYSVSFPFPTYAMFWMSSGFGRWGGTTAGIVFTLLNVAAACALIALSLKLADVDLESLLERSSSWLFLIVLFVAVNSQIWTTVFMGQTATIAACLIVLGIWFARTSFVPHEAIAGLALALGLLIKPNFTPLLLYFFFAWRHARVRSERARAAAVLHVVLFTGAFALFLVLGSIASGVRVATYADFVHTSIPIVEREIFEPNNVSVSGALADIAPGLRSPRAVTVVLLLITVLLGFKYRLVSWAPWLVLSLLISPITWAFYTALLLPVQLRLARVCSQKDDRVGLALLVISMGLIYILRTLPGLIGLLAVFYLTVLYASTDSSGSERASPAVAAAAVVRAR